MLGVCLIHASLIEVKFEGVRVSNIQERECGQSSDSMEKLRETLLLFPGLGPGLGFGLG